MLMIFLTCFMWQVLGKDRAFVETVEMVIEDAPTADVVPVVHARWIDDTYCSNCSHFEEDDEGHPVFSFSDYCPCCGAKMDGKEKQ